MRHRQELGRAGEELALAFLAAGDFVLLARNVRTRYGELDLVGREGTVLVVVEVRARASLRCGTPEESLTYVKRRRLWMTAALLLPKWPAQAVRFDLVTVRFGQGEVDVRRYQHVVGRWV